MGAWTGNNIRIHNNKVHHCPHSGIRVDKGDYISIEHNQIYSNTWWGSSAESAVVIAEATDIDHYAWTKIFLLSNIVYDNRNFIPFYNPSHESGDPDLTRPDYGTAEQTYIIDGSGVYVTRNSDTFTHGRMRLSHNKAYNNGINGLVVHKTDSGGGWEHPVGQWAGAQVLPRVQAAVRGPDRQHRRHGGGEGELREDGAAPGLRLHGLLQQPHHG